MIEKSAQLIDLKKRSIYPAKITIEGGKIAAIAPTGSPTSGFALPGLVDAHIHIESSMLIPSQFARMAVVHGTVATVSDPHEIANVMGVEGVHYMLENGGKVPFKFNFGVPSCVPATAFESAGAVLDSTAVTELLQHPELRYLSEMMNYPGVLFSDEEVMKKIAAAHAVGKPVDGHAPGLKGQQAKQYIEAGISTDHECFTLEEALDKLKYGMKIIIREGSAARNFEALHSLLTSHPDKVMLCSDDKHPDDLMVGHINLLVKRALEKGHDMFDILTAACVNPVQHYQLPVGLLKVGDPADFILIDDPKKFNVLETWIDGKQVAENGKSSIPAITDRAINQFNIGKKEVTDFQVKAAGGSVQAIVALDGEIVTGSSVEPVKVENGFAVSDPAHDVLKITVVNRYQEAAPAVAFIKGFGLKKGAIASTVAHDSHNIVAVGVSDEAICEAVNQLVASKGGVVAYDGQKCESVALPVAGLMSPLSGEEVGKAYQAADGLAKEMGSTLKAPFMALSFMALLVIPSLKLSDKGLFDGTKFEFADLFPATAD